MYQMIGTGLSWIISSAVFEISRVEARLFSRKRTLFVEQAILHGGSSAFGSFGHRYDCIDQKESN
jgi:hypothetical protein